MKTIRCPVCRGGVGVRTATGRKSKKPFLMLVSPVDGRHFRAFISDSKFIEKVLASAGADGQGRAAGRKRGLP